MLIICLSVEGRLSCFYLLSIMNVLFLNIKKNDPPSSFQDPEFGTCWLRWLAEGGPAPRWGRMLCCGALSSECFVGPIRQKCFARAWLDFLEIIMPGVFVYLRKAER